MPYNIQNPYILREMNRQSYLASKGMQNFNNASWFFMMDILWNNLYYCKILKIEYIMIGIYLSLEFLTIFTYI